VLNDVTELTPFDTFIPKVEHMWFAGSANSVNVNVSEVIMVSFKLCYTVHVSLEMCFNQVKPVVHYNKSNNTLECKV
jgi:hypothetical protein